jgi:hypothetical protein
MFKNPDRTSFLASQAPISPLNFRDIICGGTRRTKTKQMTKKNSTKRCCSISELFEAYLAFFDTTTAALFLLVVCVFALLFGAGELILAVLVGAAVVESAAKAGAVMATTPSTINDVSLIFIGSLLVNRLTLKSRNFLNHSVPTLLCYPCGRATFVGHC